VFEKRRVVPRRAGVIKRETQNDSVRLESPALGADTNKIHEYGVPSATARLHFVRKGQKTKCGSFFSDSVDYPLGADKDSPSILTA